MARGVNKVILVGNVGGDPEVRYMPNGNAVANLSVATAESWKDKQTGDRQERTEWHRVVCFNKLGEIVSEYVRKGTKLYVEGSLRTRKWQDQQGQDKYTTEIVASDIQMLDSRGSAGSSQFDNTAQPSYQDTSNNSQPNQGHTQQPSPAVSQSAGLDDLDDDVPF